MLKNLMKMLGKKDKSQGRMTITISGDGGGSMGSQGATTADIRPLPLIGRMAARKQYMFAGGMLLGSIIAAAALNYYADKEKTYYQRHKSVTLELSEALNTLASEMLQVSNGKDSFLPGALLTASKVRDHIGYMRYPVFKSIPPLVGAARVELDGINGVWSEAQKTLDKLQETTTLSLSLKAKIEGLKKQVATVRQDAQALSAMDLGKDNTASARLAMSLENIVSYLDNAESNVSFGNSAQVFASNAEIVQTDLRRLRASTLAPEAKKLVDSLDKSVSGWLGDVSAMVQQIKPEDYKLSATNLLGSIQRISMEVERLENAIAARMNASAYFNYAAAVLALISLLSLLLLGAINTIEGRKRAAEAKAENESNQRAIMHLLDEIANLADGDLTVRASVSEAITGAIADSMNFAVTQLNDLVKRIQESAGQIQSSVTLAKTTSGQLLKISENQTQDISSTGNAVLGITGAIAEIVRGMEKSQDVAQQSVASSQKGLESVNQSIQGIRSIKENVDETAKRIKRLTESSQQISQVVELIQDIAEQTAVLAINATVQATKAGAAGKSFKVVADAVQDLANRSTDAARKVAAMVSATQTDIQGAANAMDKTSEEAGKGSVLAEQTGEALMEINEVSMTLAEIVADVSGRVTSSGKAAEEVTQTTKKLLESVATSEKTVKQSVGAVDEINKLSEELRDSVTGFKV